LPSLTSYWIIHGTGGIGACTTMELIDNIILIIDQVFGNKCCRHEETFPSIAIPMYAKCQGGIGETSDENRVIRRVLVVTLAIVDIYYQKRKLRHCIWRCLNGREVLFATRSYLSLQYDPRPTVCTAAADTNRIGMADGSCTIIPGRALCVTVPGNVYLVPTSYVRGQLAPFGYHRAYSGCYYESYRS